MLDKFVRVRLVQANALDLSLFQFDYDLTFAAFFLNADRTVYGRYGSRSDSKHADRDISLDGFRKAMLAALELHQGYPANKLTLAGKQPVAPQFRAPEDYPSLAGKYKPTLDYEGKVARSCMHCHQVREAERIHFRAQSNSIPDDILFLYPMPDTIGLVLEPSEMARVAKVMSDTPAAKAGFKRGDHILSLQSQPITSIADVQWVLQHAPDVAEIKAIVRRGTKHIPLEIDLPQGWRGQTDIGWRTSTWDLRRMALGGLVLRDLTERERKAANIAPESLGLLIEYVGLYGEHAAGMKAGFKTNDVLREVGQLDRRVSEGNLIQQILRTYKPGTRVPTKVLRGNETVELQLPVQ